MQLALNLELEKIHQKIAEMLGLERDLLTFNYLKDNEKTTLSLVTTNPRHQQVFLFHTTNGFGEIDALNKMQEYVEENKNTKNTYTIQWSINGSAELHTSYFIGKNIYELLDKFYYGAGVLTLNGAPEKAITDTIIFNISLNPLS